MSYRVGGWRAAAWQCAGNALFGPALCLLASFSRAAISVCLTACWRPRASQGWSWLLPWVPGAYACVWGAARAREPGVYSPGLGIAVAFGSKLGVRCSAGGLSRLVGMVPPPWLASEGLLSHLSGKTPVAGPSVLLPGRPVRCCPRKRGSLRGPRPPG